jgi:hypothetical protein
LLVKIFGGADQHFVFSRPNQVVAAFLIFPKQLFKEFLLHPSENNLPQKKFMKSLNPRYFEFQKVAVLHCGWIVVQGFPSA